MKSPTKRVEQELVRGWLHEPDTPSGDGIALTHGAGSNCEAPLLRAIAEEMAGLGWWVLRFDLPYRQARLNGPPFPAQAARDRDGIRRALNALREVAPGKLYLAGHSYGGRQATMVAAEQPDVADALLLLSYPLHPPGKPEQLRTAHFANLRNPALFVHGTRDPFGSTDEMREALRLIPARTGLEVIAGAPHGLPPSSAAFVVSRFAGFLSSVV